MSDPHCLRGNNGDHLAFSLMQLRDLWLGQVSFTSIDTIAVGADIRYVHVVIASVAMLDNVEKD
jgi:hypothetical protein